MAYGCQSRTYSCQSDVFTFGRDVHNAANNRKGQERGKELRVDHSHVCSFLRVTGDDPALVGISRTLETDDRGAICTEAYREEIISVK